MQPLGRYFLHHPLSIWRTIAIVVLTLIGVGAVSVYYLCFYEPYYQGHIELTDQVGVFAHRGFGNHAPDNSLAGAALAVKAGFDGIDVDAQLSRDGQVMIFHDVTLERFTTGTGRVADLTAAELATYDLAPKYGADFPSTTIATLEQFMAAVPSTTDLMVELKVASMKDTGIEAQVSELIAQYDAYDQVLVSSFNPVVLYRLKQINPRIKTVFIFMDDGWDPERIAATNAEDRVTLPWFLRTEFTRTFIRKLITPDAVSINQFVDEAVIDKLIAKGYPVFLWSLNDTAALSWGLAKRPYAIISDEPPQAKALRDATTGLE